MRASIQFFTFPNSKIVGCWHCILFSITKYVFRMGSHNGAMTDFEAGHIEGSYHGASNTSQMVKLGCILGNVGRSQWQVGYVFWFQPWGQGWCHWRKSCKEWGEQHTNDEVMMSRNNGPCKQNGKHMAEDPQNVGLRRSSRERKLNQKYNI